MFVVVRLDSPQLTSRSFTALVSSSFKDVDVSLPVSVAFSKAQIVLQYKIITQQCMAWNVSSFKSKKIAECTCIAISP